MRAASHHPPASNYRVISVLAAIVLVVSSSTSPSAQPAIEIVAASDLTVSSDSAPQRMLRSFADKPSAACDRSTPPKTLSDILGPDGRRILIHRHTSAWSNLPTVAGYIRRLLNAPPETGAWAPFQIWSEGPFAEIDASIESSARTPRPLELGNGYAHTVDTSGCEWWGRYLGGDRSKWIVR